MTRKQIVRRAFEMAYRSVRDAASEPWAASTTEMDVEDWLCAHFDQHVAWSIYWMVLDAAKEAHQNKNRSSINKLHQRLTAAHWAPAIKWLESIQEYDTDDIPF